MPHAVTDSMQQIDGNHSMFFPHPSPCIRSRYHITDYKGARSSRLQQEGDGTEDGGQTGTSAGSGVDSTGVKGGLGGGGGRDGTGASRDQGGRGRHHDGGGGQRSRGRAKGGMLVEMDSWGCGLRVVGAYHLLHWVTVWVIRGRVTVKEPVMVRWPGWKGG